MKKYQITVNGQTYQVEVEELGGQEQNTTSNPAPAPKPTTPKPSAKSAPAAKPAAGQGSITAPMPGTILSIKVKEGDQVSQGDVLAVLEAMKMENDITAPTAGTVTKIAVQEGQSVNSGDVIVELE